MEEDFFFTTAMSRFFGLEEALRSSLTVGQEYDDNIRLESKEFRQGSWKALFIPSLALDFSGERTSLLLNYRPTLTYYYEGEDDLDTDHTAGLKFYHSFSPRYWVRIDNLFLRKETPQDIRRPAIPQERNADYNFNLVHSAVGSQATEKIVWQVEYANWRFNYDESMMKRYFNRTSNVGEAGSRYQFNPNLRLNCSYIYRHTDYDQANTDYQSHIFRLGFDYRVVRGVSARLWGGYQSRHYRTGQNLTGPYVEFNIVVDPHDDLRLRFAYWHRIEDTYKITHRGVWENGVEFSARYTLLPKVNLTLDYLGIFLYYPSSTDSSGEVSSSNETFWRLSTGVEFQVLEKTALTLGYRRTDNSSDSPGASYHRNQVYFQASQSF